MKWFWKIINRFNYNLELLYNRELLDNVELQYNKKNLLEYIKESLLKHADRNEKIYYYSKSFV